MQGLKWWLAGPKLHGGLFGFTYMASDIFRPLEDVAVGSASASGPLRSNATPQLDILHFQVRCRHFDTTPQPPARHNRPPAPSASHVGCALADAALDVCRVCADGWAGSSCGALMEGIALSDALQERRCLALDATHADTNQIKTLQQLRSKAWLSAVHSTPESASACVPGLQRGGTPAFCNSIYASHLEVSTRKLQETSLSKQAEVQVKSPRNACLSCLVSCTPGRTRAWHSDTFCWC